MHLCIVAMATWWNPNWLQRQLDWIQIDFSDNLIWSKLTSATTWFESNWLRWHNNKWWCNVDNVPWWKSHGVRASAGSFQSLRSIHIRTAPHAIVPRLPLLHVSLEVESMTIYCIMYARKCNETVVFSPVHRCRFDGHDKTIKIHKNEYTSQV